MTQTPEIQEELRAAGARALLEMDRSLCFSVPEQYFSGFPERVMQRTMPESEVLPPTMSALGKEHPFAAPAGYFEQLSGHIIKRVQQEPTAASVVSMTPRRKNRFTNYILAASVAALAALIGWYVWQWNDHVVTEGDFSITGLEKVPGDSLEAFLLEAEYTARIDEIPETLFPGQSLVLETASLEHLLNEMPDEDLAFYASEIL